MSQPTQATPNEIHHTAKRNPVSKAVTVHYECPQCKAGIRSPLADAGKREKCPECGYTFVVPGMKLQADERIRETKKQEEDSKGAANKAVLREYTDVVKAEHAKERQAVKTEKQARKVKKKLVKNWHTPTTQSYGFFGVLFVIAAFLVLVFAFIVQVTVVGAVVGLNITTTIFGCTLLLVGAVLLGVGAIGSEINRWGSLYAHQRDEENIRRENEDDKES